MEMSPKSLLEMARGAFLERFDYEVPKIINNILDPNTKATAKRKITMTMTFAPTDDRVGISAELEVKVGLAPTLPVQTFCMSVATPKPVECRLSRWYQRCPGSKFWTAGSKSLLLSLSW